MIPITIKEVIVPILNINRAVTLHQLTRRTNKGLLRSKAAMVPLLQAATIKATIPTAGPPRILPKDTNNMGVHHPSNIRVTSIMANNIKVRPRMRVLPDNPEGLVDPLRAIEVLGLL
jgi:hypothetical protein